MVSQSVSGWGCHLLTQIIATPLTHPTLEILNSFLGNLDDLECGGRVVSHDRNQGNVMFSNRLQRCNTTFPGQITSDPSPPTISHTLSPGSGEYQLQSGRNNNNLERTKHQRVTPVKQTGNLAQIIIKFARRLILLRFKLNSREINFSNSSRFSSWIEQGRDNTLKLMIFS